MYKQYRKSAVAFQANSCTILYRSVECFVYPVTEPFSPAKTTVFQIPLPALGMLFVAIASLALLLFWHV